MILVKMKRSSGQHIYHWYQIKVSFSLYCNGLFQRHFDNFTADRAYCVSVFIIAQQLNSFVRRQGRQHTISGRRRSASLKISQNNGSDVQIGTLVQFPFQLITLIGPDSLKNVRNSEPMMTIETTCGR